MEKFSSRKKLIEAFTDYCNSDEYTRYTLLLSKERNLVLSGRAIKSEVNYTNIKYDSESKILYGRPCNVDVALTEAFMFVDNRDLKSIEENEFNKLHKYFNGLSEESFVNVQFETLSIPPFIKDCEKNSFKGCICKKELMIPTHLLYQLINADIQLQDGCSLTLIGTGDFGIHFSQSKYPIRVPNLFKQGETLEIYKDKLAVNSSVFMTHFEFEKFYNNVNEFITCLLLAKYNVYINSNVTMAVLDFYKNFTGR